VVLINRENVELIISSVLAGVRQHSELSFGINRDHINQLLDEGEMLCSKLECGELNSEELGNLYTDALIYREKFKKYKTNYGYFVNKSE